MSVQLLSDAFLFGRPIPLQYSGDGQDLSPPLKWTGLPENTQELALIVEDPDAPANVPFVHWVIYRIKPDSPGLPAGIAPDAAPSAPLGVMQGKNSFKRFGYAGPKPPPGHGVHHYHFRLYVLDKPLQVQTGLDAQALMAAMAGNIVDQGELIGTYER